MGISFYQRLWLMGLHVPASKTAKALALAVSNGLAITRRELAAHQRAGGDAEVVVAGLLLAREHSLRLNWLDASPDLRGGDAEETVEQYTHAVSECCRDTANQQGLQT